MSKFDPNDTIAAIATPCGDSGIGIVRISGKEALKIADSVFVSRDKTRPSDFKTYSIHYGWIAGSGGIIDEVLLTVMRAPRSYTRQDVVEINCHGGTLALRAALELVLTKGCRLAEPGEFTRRAFLNGRIDLAQAEAVMDIIRAKSEFALRMSAEQLKGELSLSLDSLRKSLLDILSSLEAAIDFPEEGIESPDPRAAVRSLIGARNRIEQLLDKARQGRVLREGVKTVICGRPNVGKSSLLNALLKEERAIVTPVAGTTRDTLEEIIDIKGIPVIIVDTAGIIEPRDLVEKKAVSRSRKYIAAADLVILLLDASSRICRQDRLLMKRLKKKNTIVAINKIDLKQKIDRRGIPNGFKRVVEISAKKSGKIGLLEDAIADAVCGGRIEHPESIIVSRLRHIEALKRTENFIAQAVNSLDNKLSPEFAAEGIKAALGELDAITGRGFSEDLLDKIFSEFCIGK